MVTDKPPETNYKPRPGFQRDALMSPADYLLTGGQAGPGKTWWLCFNALFDYRDVGLGKPPLHLYKFPKYRGVLLRREQKQTEQILTEAQPLYEALGAKYRGSPHNDFTFPAGAKITLSHMNNPDDWMDHRGIERQYMGFDELAEFLEFQVAGVLPWLRSTIPGVRARFCGTTNPEGEGMPFVQEWWNIQCPCPEHKGINNPFWKTVIMESGKEIRSLWHFIPGTRKGSVMEEMNPQYEGTLAMICGGVDSPRFKALGRGCWKVAKGSFFGNFSPVHVIPDNFEFSGKWGWVWVIGHDWASSPQGDASSWVLMRVNQDLDVVVEHEWYSWGCEVQQQSESLKLLCSEEKVPLHQASIYSGQDVFMRNRGSGGEVQNIADQFLKRQGLVLRKTVKDVKNAAALVRGGLRSSLDKRRGGIYIKKRCQRLIADFDGLLSDKKKLDEWDKDQRIKVSGNKYHFDVFQAFRQGYCGAFSAEAPEYEDDSQSDRRKDAVKKASGTRTENWNCSYPLR